MSALAILAVKAIALAVIAYCCAVLATTWWYETVFLPRIAGEE